MAENVSPTRMNLLQRKAQIALAGQGVELLKNKRDALMKEFFDLVKPLLGLRRKFVRQLQECRTELHVTLALEGEARVFAATLACKRDVELKVTQKNLWGIRIAEPASFDFVRSGTARGYSAAGTSGRVDETAQSFERALTTILEMAPLFLKLKKLGEDIKKTTRRVNALEQRVIPTLASEMRFIRMTLEQRAREDIFRLKLIKGKDTGEEK